MHNLSNEYFQSEYETGSNYELSPEFETSNESAYELSPEFEMNSEYEVAQNELAQELMEINSEAEFGAWLSNLGRRAAGVASNFLRSPIGQQATSALGDIARRTLPNLAGRAGNWLGGRIGGIVGQAGAGQQYGQQLGNMAGQAAADRYPDFVRFATDTLSNLSKEYESGAAPAVRPAIVNAAAKHYPIILKVKGTLRVRPVRGSMQSEYEYNNEYANEFQGEITNNEGTFNEVTEMELASELLNVQSEAELDQFLGNLFKKAAGAVSSFARSGVGRALGGVLRGVAKTALPIAGSALGSFIAPGIGTSIGGSLGSALGNLFELELEGLSAEDREFETARAFVRFAGNAARRAATNTNTTNPAAVARTAVVQAAKNYAPGILVTDHRRRPSITVHDHRTNSGSGQNDQTGSWYRDGNSIVIEGV